MEELRIDKYLWSIRVYKTRTDATDACKGGKVRVNGADTKPSKSVKVGDGIVARKGAVTYTYKVLELIDKRQGAKLVPRYAENLTPQEELDKLRAPVQARQRCRTSYQEGPSSDGGLMEQPQFRCS